MCTTNRYCKAIFLSLEVRVCHAICLGENSHWKGGVWGEQSARTPYLPVFPVPLPQNLGS